MFASAAFAMSGLGEDRSIGANTAHNFTVQTQGQYWVEFLQKPRLSIGFKGQPRPFLWAFLPKEAGFKASIKPSFSRARQVRLWGDQL